MKFPKIVPVTILVCATAATALAQDRTALPSITELRSLASEPVREPSAASPADIESALKSFQLFHSGLPQVVKWKDQGGSRSPKDTHIYDLAKGAVVYIQADTGKSDDQKHELFSTGAGSILYPDDLMITAFHVVRDAMDGNTQKRQIMVFLKPANSVSPSDTLAYRVIVEYFNESKDLAVLHFLLHPLNDLVKLKLGNMSNLVVGQDVHVIGHPGGLYWTYTTGIISQIRKNYKTSMVVGGSQEHPEIQTVEGDVLQIQSAINPGNSGGPILDDSGSLIGVVSAEVPNLQNTNFAIAASEVDGLMERRDKWAAAGRPATPTSELRPEVFRGRTSEGLDVIKFHYPDHDAYMVRGSDGKLKGWVAEAKDVVVRAANTNGDRGFSSWTAEFSDGSRAEGSGTEVPTSFQTSQ